MNARTHNTTIPAWRWVYRALLVALIGVAAIAQPATTSPPSTTPAAVPASRQADNVAILTIEGLITAVTTASMERRIDKAVTSGADAIVVDIDSPGGEVYAVLELCALLRRSPVPTYGWVNPNAYSGGAFVALACDHIVLAKGATMGDAAPIVPGMSLPETERQKMLAPLLAELVECARLHGYDEKLVQSFVTLGVELWYIEDTQTGQKYFVDEAEYVALFGEEPSRLSPHVGSGTASGTGTTAPSARDRFPTVGTSAPVPDTRPAGRLNRGAGGTDAEFIPAADSISQETIDTINKTIAEPSTRPDFSQADPSRYRLVHYATDGNTLLTLKESDLKLYGFADETINTDEELKRYFAAKNLARLDQTWSETMVGVMTQGMTGLVIRGLLIVLFLLGLFIEMSMPGLGLPGGVAVLALLGLVVPPMMIGAASWWAGVVILGGVAFILLEIFIFPGFGVPGVLGLVMLLGGLVGTFAGAGELFPGSSTGDYAETLYAVSITGVALFVAIVGMFLFSKYTHKFPVIGGLVLAGESSQGGSMGILEAMGSAGEPTHTHLREGDRGETITTLRPSGTARFGDDLVDVVAKLGFVDSGVPVRVAQITDFRILVVPDDSDGAAPPMPGLPPLPVDDADDTALGGTA